MPTYLLIAYLWFFLGGTFLTFRALWILWTLRPDSLWTQDLDLSILLLGPIMWLILVGAAAGYALVHFYDYLVADWRAYRRDQDLRIRDNRFHVVPFGSGVWVAVDRVTGVAALGTTRKQALAGVNRART